MVVYFTLHKGIYAFFTLNEKGKPAQVPVEQCQLKDILEPSEYSINYWNHYGIDRKYFLSRTKQYVEPAS